MKRGLSTRAIASHRSRNSTALGSVWCSFPQIILHRSHLALPCAPRHSTLGSRLAPRIPLFDSGEQALGRVMTDRMDDGPDVGVATAAAASADSAAAPAPSASLANPALLPLLHDQKLRFILELEFVEMLASPQYLHFLAQSRYLSQPAFLNYLAYLQYWHNPEYLPFIAHPHALYFLDLLHVSEAFRSACLNPAFINLMHEQTFFHWRSSRYNTFVEAEAKRDAARAKKAAAAAAATAAKEQEQQLKDEHGDATQPLADPQKGQHGS